MLHTINKSPFEKNSLELCLEYASDGSDILLIEDGVYAAIRGSAVESKLTASNCTIYALGPDLKARGIEEDRLLDGINIVGFDGFVKLTADNDKVQSWL